MKRILIALLAVAAVLPLRAAAPADTLTLDQLKAALLADPQKAGANHYNYPVEAYVAAPAPKGYEAVYISHYGRHGSRYITDHTKYDDVAGFLSAAKEKGLLTPEGENLYDDYMSIYPDLQYHKGDLTILGQQQHRQIARRMAKAYPALFKKNSGVDARASESPRAIISMMSFCDELRQINPKLNITYCADNSEMDVTALATLGQSDESATNEFYSLFRTPAFGRAWAEEQKEIAYDKSKFFLRYFRDMEPLKDCGDLDDFMTELAEIAYNIQCLPIKADLAKYFTPEETFLSWENTNMYAVMMFLDSPFSRGLITARAWQLMDDIITLANNDIASGDVKARLRFGHDSVVGPLMSFLGIDGWGAVDANIPGWKYVFQSWNIPMASNVQFIFYRNKKDHSDLLVRVMYNESDQILPLPDQSLAPYYRWDDFVAYYKPIMASAREKCEAFRSGSPIVNVESGKLQGVRKDDVLIYRGVPFAAPPLGELRGKPLQAVQPWEGVLQADTFRAAELQSPFSPDDPLYYREFYAEGEPEFSEDCMYLNIWAPASTVSLPEAKLPVAVWIHGGAFAHGFSFEKEMDGEEWAKRGVILVTIPYRVGELGYGTPEQLGFRDQEFALEWVQKNIGAFGGDPSNVTVFGQSAGAISVKYLLMNPEAKGLFAKAIIQSGGGLNEMSVPPILPEGTRGEIIPKALAAGAFDSKPIMIGYTAQDPDFLGRPTTIDFCEKVSARGNKGVFCYAFNRNLPGEKEGEIDFGAFHSAELWYTFGTLGRAWRPFTEGDYELSRRMLDAWTSFARKGNPGWEAYNADTKHIEEFDVAE